MSLAHARLERPSVFSKAQCEELLNHVQAFEPGRWHRRLKINSLPTTEVGRTDHFFAGTQADYYFCGDANQPPEFNALFRAMAPVIEGHFLTEAIINRYEIGQGMAEHVDRALYRVNLVIPLVECGDGLFVEDVWYEDIAGAGVYFKSNSPRHYVPPVKSQRFLAIYLYE
ncbi:hypothetical protein ACLPJK_25830 [Pseudomonas aeruginosa]|uniref:hypothetical protein n=1 Tax=Pseudomonas aeruginosa TaxID=287 RepID=UPI003D2A809B